MGAGLGFILPGEKTPLKLMMIGGGGASTWFLHTHKATLGPFRDWGMIASNTALGSGIGWLGCNCHDGLIGGALLGGGGTAVWEALKNDRPARNTFNSATDRGASNKTFCRRTKERRPMGGCALLQLALCPLATKRIRDLRLKANNTHPENIF